MLRNAFNITHLHLRDKYSLRLGEGKLYCNISEVQATLFIAVQIDEPVDLFRIADDMINKNYPIRYTLANLSEEDLASLKSILPKDLKLTYHSPILEITYEH